MSRARDSSIRVIRDVITVAITQSPVYIANLLADARGELALIEELGSQPGKHRVTPVRRAPKVFNPQAPLYVRHFVMPQVMVPVLRAQEDGRKACLCEPDEEWGVHGGGGAARVAAQRWGKLLRIPNLPSNKGT